MMEQVGLTPSQPPAGLRLIHASPVCAMAEYERCIITVWHLQPTPEAFDIRHRELVDLATRYPGQCGYVELIEPTSKPPPNEMRKTAVEVFRKLDKNVCCVGFVVDGTQFRSALVRAILATMSFLVPPTQAAKVFKRLGEMAEWVRTRIHEEDPAFNARLVRAFEYLRNVT
jgi:hypothetical protein